MALFALFVALGGTSFAAGNAVLARNSVGTRQVIDGSLQTSDLSSKARSALKGNDRTERRNWRSGPSYGLDGRYAADRRTGAPGATGSTGAPGATGATGPHGPPGAPGQSASNLFVAIDSDGTLSEEQRRDGCVDRAGVGVYRIQFDTDITELRLPRDGGTGQRRSLFEDYHVYTSRTGTSTVNVADLRREGQPARSAFLSRGHLLNGT